MFLAQMVILKSREKKEKISIKKLIYIKLYKVKEGIVMKPSLSLLFAY